MWAVMKNVHIRVLNVFEPNHNHTLTMLLSCSTQVIAFFVFLMFLSGDSSDFKMDQNWVLSMSITGLRHKKNLRKKCHSTNGIV